jgi:hypothetical protein
MILIRARVVFPCEGVVFKVQTQVFTAETGASRKGEKGKHLRISAWHGIHISVSGGDKVTTH